jgi:site-specific recombinase XerD
MPRQNETGTEARSLAREIEARSLSREIEEYLAYIQAVRGLSPRTVESYREDLCRYSIFLDGRGIDAATASDIRDFAAELIGEGKAGSSVNRALSALRGYYRYRVRFGALAADPSRDVEGFSVRRSLPRFLFEDEAAAFIALADGDDFAAIRDRAILEFLYSTGCRVAETSSLRLDRLDLEGGSAKVTGKGSKERVVFLSDSARAALAAYLPVREALMTRTGASLQAKKPDCVFVNSRGGPLSERGIEWLIEGYARRAGIGKKISPHTFRHSFATHLVGHGADIRVVQELLGHSSVSTTQIYAHVDMERLRKVYEQAHPHGGGK